MRGQDNPLNDADLKKMLKEAEEMQKAATELSKKNPPASKEKMAELEAQAKSEQARMETEEKLAKETRRAGTGRITRLDTGYPGIQGRRRASEKNRGRSSKNCSIWDLIAYSRKNSRQLASGSKRKEQSQSEP